MKVLVTGASGFLGGWLVKRLLADGCHVRVLCRDRNNLGEVQGLQVEVAIGDVTDTKSLISAMEGVNTVFHLAGLIAYSRTQRNAMEVVNVQGTANVVQACESAKVKKLVYMSSVVAIGASFDGTPLNEESAYNVADLDLGYFQTKHRAENIVREAVQRGRIDAVILNPSTIYGPADAKKGSRGIQLKVARGKLPFYTSGGVNVISVEDVVDATIEAWKRGRSGERYILAGENLLIRDLFRIIARASGVKPPPLLLPRPVVFAVGKVGDALEKIGKKGPLNSENAWTSTLYHWFDSSKAQRELGLNPKPAEYAIAQSVGWMKDQGLLKS
jgi:dihydroflavonol-4-reductase